MSDTQKATWLELAKLWPQLPETLQQAIVLLVEALINCYGQREESPEGANTG